MFRDEVERTFPMPNFPNVAFIGFGEAGQAIASGWRDAGARRSQERRAGDPQRRQRRRARPAFSAPALLQMSRAILKHAGQIQGG
jgi:pyrroline-5-carboxylate reductase